MSATVIVLTTDFGEGGPYVGMMKGVIYTLHPGAVILDFTHRVAPQQVREGAFLLHTAAPYFPPHAIQVAVVDPGVGTARRALCLDLGERSYLIGPDNGLFSYFIEEQPGLTARAITNPAFLRQPVSHTFHGRDIFAPTAALLARGEPFEAVGPLIDPASLIRLPDLRPQWDQAKNGARRVRGEVVHIDNFGNLITNLDQALFAGLATDNLAAIQTTLRDASGATIYTCTSLAVTYGEHPPGAIIALISSGGFLEIARVNGRADRHDDGRRILLGAAVEVVVLRIPCVTGDPVCR